MFRAHAERHSLSKTADTLTSGTGLHFLLTSGDHSDN